MCRIVEKESLDWHRDIEFKLAPSMLLDLKGMHGDLSRGVWKGRVQVEDHLTSHESASVPLKLPVNTYSCQKWPAVTHLFDDVTDVLSINSSDVQIPFVGLCLSCLQSETKH